VEMISGSSQATEVGVIARGVSAEKRRLELA
jgi:hypothetical protein